MENNHLVLGVLFTTLLLLLLVAGLFISIYISGKNRLKQEIKMTQMALSYEQEMRRAETEMSEHMMERFALELHDNIGHILTCMRITIENKKMDSEENAALYQPIDGYLDEAAEQIKLLSRSFNTEYIKSSGLMEAIGLEVNRINALRRISIEMPESSFLPPFTKDTELLVFRIFQEIVNNAIKHSGAKKMLVEIDGENGFRMLVKDNGRGFDRDMVFNSKKASGLRNILKRAEMAGLNCLIDTAPGNGCSYIFTLKVV